MRMSYSIPSTKLFVCSAGTCPPLLELFSQLNAFKHLKHTWASLNVSSETAQLSSTSISSQHVTHIVFIWIRLSRVHWSLWMGSLKSKRLPVSWPFCFICHVPGWLISYIYAKALPAMTHRSWGSKSQKRSWKCTFFKESSFMKADQLIYLKKQMKWISKGK